MYLTSQITENSYPLIRELYKKAFGLKEPLSLIQRKYDTDCFGLRNIGILAETEEHETAAYYGVFPVTLRYDSVDFLAAQSGDTMTAPDHRNKGLFVTLARETYQLAEQKGVKIIFGFPNQNSYPGFKRKLDWVFNGSMQKFTIAKSGIPFCELAYKWRFLEPMYKEYARRRLSKFRMEANDANIHCFNQKTEMGYIKKDLNYFNYKLRNPDNYLIRIDGFTLLIKPWGNLIIGAVGYFEEDKRVEFSKSVKKLSGILSCRKAIMALTDNHWLYRYLVSSLKPEESLPVGFYRYNDHFDLRQIEFVQADYDTF